MCKSMRPQCRGCHVLIYPENIKNRSFPSPHQNEKWDSDPCQNEKPDRDPNKISGGQVTFIKYIKSLLYFRF
jgi:hypothetical protein